MEGADKKIGIIEIGGKLWRAGNTLQSNLGYPFPLIHVSLVTELHSFLVLFVTRLPLSSRLCYRAPVSQVTWSKSFPEDISTLSSQLCHGPLLIWVPSLTHFPSVKSSHRVLTIFQETFVTEITLSKSSPLQRSAHPSPPRYTFPFFQVISTTNFHSSASTLSQSSTPRSPLGHRSPLCRW